MKDDVLVVTPLYKIMGRNDLIQDSDCVHTLVKYWTNDYNVNVLFNYINGFSKIKNIITPNKMKKILNGYNYDCDNVNVVISERQNLIPNQINGNSFDYYVSKRILKKNNMLKNYKFIVFHLPSTSQFLVNIFSNNKYAILHQTDLQYLKKHPTKFKKFLEKNFQKVFCRSKAIHDEVKKFNLKNLDDRIINSGVNTIKLKNKKVIDTKMLKFLYVGKLIKRKNLDLLIKSLSTFDRNTWKLDIIGVGKMNDEYKKLVSDLKIEKNVCFLGKKSRKEVLKTMEESDVFCMPSVKETLGLVYLEAMSKGCITIGTLKEGIDGIIVDSDNGFLVSPNINSLVECIKKIKKLDKTKIDKLSRNAIKTALEYNEYDMSKQYLSYIEGENIYDKRCER